MSASRARRLRDSATKRKLYEAAHTETLLGMHHIRQEEKLDLLVQQVYHLTLSLQSLFLFSVQAQCDWACQQSQCWDDAGDVGIPVEALEKECHAARQIQRAVRSWLSKHPTPHHVRSEGGTPETEYKHWVPSSSGTSMFSTHSMRSALEMRRLHVCSNSGATAVQLRRMNLC